MPEGEVSHWKSRFLGANFPKAANEVHGYPQIWRRSLISRSLDCCKRSRAKHTHAGTSGSATALVSVHPAAWRTNLLDIWGCRTTASDRLVPDLICSRVQGYVPMKLAIDASPVFHQCVVSTTMGAGGISTAVAQEDSAQCIQLGQIRDPLKGVSHEIRPYLITCILRCALAYRSVYALVHRPLSFVSVVSPVSKRSVSFLCAGV